MISHHIHTFECDIPTDTQHNFENIDSLSNGTDNSKHKLGLKFIVIFLSNSKKINYYYYYYTHHHLLLSRTYERMLFCKRFTTGYLHPGYLYPG